MKFAEMPYQRVDTEAVVAALKELTQELKAAKSGEEQFEIHQKFYALRDEYNTTIQIAMIRSDVDTADEFYSEEKNYYNEVLPTINNQETEYRKALYYSPYREVLEEKIGKVAFKSMELEFKAMDEKLIPLMQEENALTTQYDKLIASAKIDWEGEALNLSLLRPYMTHEDREIRRKAHEKYSAFFQSKAEELDEIYDKLVKNRTAQARLLGYENYVELGYYRMNRNSYGREDVENLANGQKMYEELSPETKEFFDFMMENELFDVLGRKTKKAGGYMTYLPKYRAPFIFANFNGTSGDVDVVTHECGHAFQGYVYGSDPIEEHWDITMETAEIHSMSMEFFTEPWMNLFFKEEADTYRQMHLEDAIAFIPYGCMVDEFQHIVYSNPDLTPDERHAAWKKLEEEYKPHLDYEGDPFMEKGGFWQKQLHIYDYPFYYIDYVLAQTCAMQYKIWMDEDYKAAWQSYLKLCRLSASDFYTEMLKEVGLQIPFEDGCVRTVTEKLGAMME